MSLNIKTGLAQLDKVEEEVLKELRQKHSKELEEARKPFILARQKIQETCSHEFKHEWTHPHNGEDYYKCKWCGLSKR